MRNKENKKNQIVLVSFAAVFSVMMLAGITADRKLSAAKAAQNEMSISTTEVALELTNSEISIDDAVVATSVLEPESDT